MNWIDNQDRLPLENSVYIVSVTRENYTFLAIAYFNPDTKEWSYSEKGVIGDLITDRVTGWIDNLGVYLG